MSSNPELFREFFANKKVLITGGLGFIGSTIAKKLVSLESDVLLVDSLIEGYGGNRFNIDEIKTQVTVNISDVRDRYSMNNLVKDQDLIFNLAGTLSHIDSMTDPFTDLDINCSAQLSILESIRHNNPEAKIVFAGTRGQYGRATSLPVNEDHLMRPTDVNGINNVAGESYHILYHNVYGMRASSLRLTNTYGPRHQMKHHKQGIINWFIRQIIDGETLRVFGDGTQIRDTNYVDDVVDALLIAMATNETEGEVFNIGGEPLSLVQLAEKMISVGVGGSYELVEYPSDKKPIEIGDYIADYTKFSKLTGWTPSINIEEGLEKTFEYYRQNKEQYW